VVVGQVSDSQLASHSKSVSQQQIPTSLQCLVIASCSIRCPSADRVVAAADTRLWLLLTISLNLHSLLYVLERQDALCLVRVGGHIRGALPTLGAATDNCDRV